MEVVKKKDLPQFTITNGFPDVALIEIFKPLQGIYTLQYPVRIDGLVASFEKIGNHNWTANGMVRSHSQKLIDYIGLQIEHL